MRKMTKLALSLTISGLALTLAHASRADSSYQPYYYTRDSLQFAQVTPPKPASVDVAPAVSPTSNSARYAQSATEQSAPVTVPIMNRDDRVYSQPESGMGLQPSSLSNPSKPADVIATRSADAIDLKTDQGGAIGLQVSNYRYQEHDVSNEEFMHQTGVKVGATAEGTAAFNYGLFLTGQVRFAYSKNDYSSAPTGKISNFAGDFLGEGRVLFGKDFVIGDTPSSSMAFDLSPYIGIGFRDLYNDSSQLSGGYRRNSEYFYIPVGLTNRFRISNGARISVNAEYDPLLQGRQSTYLNDASSWYPNTSNDQNQGYGLRGSVMYERRTWALGPFINYWNVNQSDTTTFAGIQCYPYYCGGTEPHNQTLEYGLQAQYRF